MRKTILICAAMLLGAPAFAVDVPPTQYQPGDAVPPALVADMGCSVPGTWTFATKVYVSKAGNLWTVIPTGVSSQVINIAGGQCPAFDPAKLKVIR